MLEKLNEKISVITIYNKDKGYVRPYKIMRGTESYYIKEVTYHHLIRNGRNLIHVFHVTDGNLDYRLELDTQNLHWKLIEVSDGNP